MNEKAIELEARMFAQATVTARKMLPIMTQEFEVRIKNNAEAWKHLQICLPAMKEGKAAYLGKTFKAKIVWDACGGIHKQHFCFLALEGVPSNLLLDSKDAAALLTQKGNAPKMFAMWKELKALNS